MPISKDAMIIVYDQEARKFITFYLKLCNFVPYTSPKATKYPSYEYVSKVTLLKEGVAPEDADSRFIIQATKEELDDLSNTLNQFHKNEAFDFYY